MSSAICKLLLIGASIFEIYMCWQFLFVCWTDKTRVSVGRKIVYAIIGIVLGTILGMNRGILFFSQTMFILQLLVIFACIITMPEQRRGVGCGVACAYFSIIALLDFLLAFIILGFIDEPGKEQIFHHPSDIGTASFLCVRIGILLFYILLKKKEDRLKETMEKYTRLLIVFSVATMIVLWVYHMIFSYFLENSFPLIGTPWIFVSLLAILTLLIWVLGLMAKSASVIKKLDYTELKDMMLEANYEQLNSLVEENRENAHDMKHHLQILREYSNQKDLEKIKEYLQEIEVPVLKLEGTVWTESRILNLILNQKKHEAEEKNIQMRIKVNGQGFFPLKDCEICSLFSNLLDNALEACDKMENNTRWIEAELQSKREMFFLKISNSIQDCPKEKNGEFKSAKASEGIHGLGLKSVKRIVERNNGDIQFKVNEDHFAVYITFFSN